MADILTDNLNINYHSLRIRRNKLTVEYYKYKFQELKRKNNETVRINISDIISMKLYNR